MTLKERSGGHVTRDPLVVFLYLLLRDKLTAGVVEKLVQEAHETPAEVDTTLSNGWLGRYAEDCAHRLTVHTLLGKP